MIHNFYGGVVFSIEYKEGKTKGIYRVIETIAEKGFAYSVLVSTVCGEVCDDAFAFDIAPEIDTAIEICDYLCRMRVGAIHLLEVLEDSVGSLDEGALALI